MTNCLAVGKIFQFYERDDKCIQIKSDFLKNHLSNSHVTTQNSLFIFKTKIVMQKLSLEY